MPLPEAKRVVEARELPANGGRACELLLGILGQTGAADTRFVPGQDVLVLNTPSFPAVRIAVPGRPTITVTAPGAPQDAYVASATLDGRALDRAWIRLSELTEDRSTTDAHLAFTTSRTPTGWGAGSGHAPPSLRARHR